MMKKILVYNLLVIASFSLSSCGGGKKEGPSNKDVPIPEMKIEQVAEMKQTEVTFPSADGLEISAILYQIDSAAPVIVLCHQAGFNKYEYAEIAPKLCKMGFTCLAIDQRSGGEMDGHENETYLRAKEKKLPTEYLNALADIIAGVNYGYALTNKPVILWGSSYSSSLALKIAAVNPNVKSVIAFSPGEYFPDKHYIGNSIKGLSKPMFVTCTEKESGAAGKLMDVTDQSKLTFFYPESKGTHGSKALWSSDPANAVYWAAVTEFLNTQK